MVWAHGPSEALHALACTPTTGSSAKETNRQQRRDSTADAADTMQSRMTHECDPLATHFEPDSVMAKGSVLNGR